MQGWDQAQQDAAADKRSEHEAAAATLAEMCQRVQGLGERFYPNEASVSAAAISASCCASLQCTWSNRGDSSHGAAQLESLQGFG